MFAVAGLAAGRVAGLPRSGEDQGAAEVGGDGEQAELNLGIG
jgi:hypothetical protein